MKKRVLITGASGFIGRALCGALAHERDVVAAVRTLPGEQVPGVSYLQTGAIDAGTDWAGALRGVETVVHLAARVHVLRETEPDPRARFLEVNRDGTRALAEASKRAGVSRFVFLSTVGVHGQRTEPGSAVREDSPICPANEYSRSKYEAELALREACQGSELEYAILRPPLVYGPGAGGNLGRLVSWIDRGIPLPLGRVSNRRSLISLANLVDCIRVMMEHPKAAGKAFVVADKDFSTPELIRLVASSRGKRAILLPVPGTVLKAAARALGARRQIDQLAGDLVIDAREITRALGWAPPFPPTLCTSAEKAIDP